MLLLPLNPEISFTVAHSPKMFLKTDLKLHPQLQLPEGLLIFIPLLHCGGAEVKLSAGWTGDAVVVVSRLRTVAWSGLHAERRDICRIKERRGVKYMRQLRLEWSFNLNKFNSIRILQGYLVHVTETRDSV